MARAQQHHRDERSPSQDVIRSDAKTEKVTVSSSMRCSSMIRTWSPRLTVRVVVMMKPLRESSNVHLVCAEHGQQRSKGEHGKLG